MITHLSAARVDGSTYDVLWRRDNGPEDNTRMLGSGNIAEAIAEALELADIRECRWDGPFPIIEWIHVRPSKRDNGLDVELRVFGTSMTGLRIPKLTMPNLLAAIQEYGKTAWAVRKHDIPVTDFAMTVERGGNNAT